MRTWLTVLALSAVLASSSGCARESVPLSPTDHVSPIPLPTHVAITAAVFEYGSGRPIAAARVFLDETDVGRTAADGTLVTQAARGEELTMYATADGYRPSLTVAGIPYTAERWTFFLERDR